MDLARASADQRDLRHVRHFSDRLSYLCRRFAELVVVVSGAPQRHRDDRHVINRSGLDERRADARGNAVGVGRQLLVQSHERTLFVLPDVEPHDDHRLPGTRGRVEILDTRHFPEQLLHRSRHPLLDLGGCGAGCIHEDVDHGHHDLRLFLSRKRDDGKGPERERCHDEERRELGMNEGLGQPAGHAHALVHGRAPVGTGSCATMRRPSVSSGGGAFTITSPRLRPASTSTPSAPS